MASDILQKRLQKRHKFKQKRHYQRFLASNDLKIRELAKKTPIDKNNILIEIFLSLINLEKPNTKKKYTRELYLLRFLSNELYQLATNKANNANLEVLNKRVEANLIEYQLLIIRDNLELKISQRYTIQKPAVKRYFSFHHIYSLIASTFAGPFLNDEKYYSYYQFAYFLTMYINLNFYIKSNRLNPDCQNIFNCQMAAQEKMILAIQEITPEHFNQFIIKINKWLYALKYPTTA